MHIGRMLNEHGGFIRFCLTEHAKKVGFRRLIEKFRKNMIYNSLDTKRIRQVMKSPRPTGDWFRHDDWKIRPNRQLKAILFNIAVSIRCTLPYAHCEGAIVG